MRHNTELPVVEPQQDPELVDETTSNDSQDEILVLPASPTPMPRQLALDITGTVETVEEAAHAITEKCDAATQTDDPLLQAAMMLSPGPTSVRLLRIEERRQSSHRSTNLPGTKTL